MSYRDVRNFTEMLRALGYPGSVSMESFRLSNFPLVANLLVWLVKRFDPETAISAKIDTENERISLVRNVAEFMAIKAGIKLNAIKLYQADGYAVKELLKIAALLYEALKVNISTKEGDDDDIDIDMRNFDITDKITDLKQFKQLATEITTTGASLYDLLGKETDLRVVRQASIARPYEANEVEIGIKKAVEAMKREIEETKQSIETLTTGEANLDAKIERRNIEIDRYEKRLQTLKKVKPAFLEEFTVLEGQLEELFVQYATRMRTMNYLEKLAADVERVYLERQQQAAVQRVVEAVPLNISGDPSDLEALEENPSLDDEEEPAKVERPRARTGGRSRGTAKVYGGAKDVSPGESSLDLSSDSDSDELLLDGDEADFDHSDEDSFGLELSGVERKIPSDRMTSSKVQDNSDDDF